MRKLWPNADGLDTVLEVPIPDDACAPRRRRTRNLPLWTRPRRGGAGAAMTPSRGAEIQLMLGVVGAPLVPHPVDPRQAALTRRDIKKNPIEASMAKYVVQQYVAASGGDKALAGVESMFAMGRVQMRSSSSGRRSSSSGGEVGGFVLWQKGSEQWSLEMVVAGCKLTAGSDGKMAWRQTPWQPAHASRGPPRPLRRCLQGLDPRATASMFAGAAWVGEKPVAGDPCFVLKADAKAAALQARCSPTTEVIRHAVWGYFSQRTGLLVRLDDSHLLRIDAGDGKESIYWETNMESHIGDYRVVDGVYIAHAGRTDVSLLHFGDGDGAERVTTRMTEHWAVEEVGFNIVGLSGECFLPPREITSAAADEKKPKAVLPPLPPAAVPVKAPATTAVPARLFGPAKVAAVNSSSDSDDGEEGEKQQRL